MKLQSRELNLVLRKTAIIVNRYRLQEGCFRKSAVWISELFLGTHERSVKNYFSGNIPHR